MEINEITEKIESCTEDELYEYWLKSDWCMICPFDVYKRACIENGTEVKKRMSIDEAIRHCEEEAEYSEQLIKTDNNGYGFHGSNKLCVAYAEKYRQLAEWLRELKAYREARKELENRQEVKEDA